MRIKVISLVLILTSYLLVLPSSVAASIYNRSPWPDAFKGLTFEKDNTDFEDAAHPCFRTAGRSFKLSHKDSFKLIGISVYVYVPNRQEGRFNQDLLRLSFLDSNNSKLITNVSPTYSAVISRDGNAQPTFEVYFPLNLNVSGGVTYTANLECLTDDDLLRIVESSRIYDGETSYYNSNMGQVTPYYLSGRKILFTTFSGWLSAHFPALASTNNQQLITSNNPPKYHPVIFVHGLGGAPGAFDGSEDQSRNYVKLLTDLGYPSDYIYLYSYGYKEDGRGGTYYNYQGDIREIAQGMEVIVNTLSEKHKASGGDGKVDIVAHSLGNLVTRQYLATHRDNHKVRRYIAVGAPFKGAWLANIDRGVYSIPLLGQKIEKSLAGAILSAYNSNKSQKIDNNSPAIKQLARGSEFFDGASGINKYLVDDVEVHALYGDINARVTQHIFSRSFTKKVSIGDGIILNDSASYIGWADSARSLAFSDDLFVEARFKRLNNALALDIDLPKLDSVGSFHTEMLSKRELKDKVVCVLKTESTSTCY